MAIVSSIRHHHITNDYNDGANYFKRFLQYAEMVSTGNMSLANTILHGLGVSEQQQQQQYELSFTTKQIKQELESKGYIVDESIGQSSFRCTMGIKKDVTDVHYSLGILVDDDSHYHNNDLVEQYYQRPSILQSFGWRILNVYAKDWFEDSNRVLTEIERALDGIIQSVAEPEVKNELSELKEEDKVHYTVLISLEGDRFWEIAQMQQQLYIRSGKTGTKGQVQVKTFTTDEDAAAAKETLTAEKMKEGFKEKES